MRWSAIVNPAAGRGRARRTRPALDAALAERGVGVCYPTGPAATAEAAATRFADGERVLVCGGDGTVASVAGVAAETGGTIGVVPLGTGNDFARQLGIDDRRPLDALALLDTGEVTVCDLGRVWAADGTTAWFTTVANTGFDAEANRWANGVHWVRGTTLYVLAMLRTLTTYRPAAVQVVVDGVAHESRAWLVAVANGRYYAGGMMIVPDAEVDDGRLDVCLVGPVSRAEFLYRFPRVFRGTHVELDTVHTWRGTTIELRAASGADGLECWASGERVGPLPATLTSVPEAVRVLVPAAAPATGR